MASEPIAAVVALGFIACSGGERQIDGPGTPGTPALTVRVGLADANLSRTLGREGAGITNLSYQRVVLRTEGGTELLQDTNTSAADFVMTPHTPGSVTR